MGRLDNKVALITGAARGQGRSHAVRFAQEGADIIALDLCRDAPTVEYPLATSEDLEQTAKLVEDLDRRILIREGDVRNNDDLQQLVADGLSEFGRLDIVVANAGIGSYAPAHELTDEVWSEVIDTNLTGVFKTARATIPTLLEQGTGGSMIFISSVAGLIAYPNLAHYVAAKHGVTGLMRALAIELAPAGIRVNSVHPSMVDTPMVDNDSLRRLFNGGVDATRAEAEETFKHLNALPIPWVDAVDISNAVLWLASDEARYVTGTTQVIDAGASSPYKIPHGMAPTP
jgi:SDR family mycofactocin-dependent oxidoreductase